MKVYTVTGGTGYIGSQLIKHLVDQGHFVYAVVRKDKSYPELEHKNIGVVIYEGDEGSLESVIANSDYIIHLGALYTTDESEESTRDLIESNILFSTQVFNAARNVNPRAVIAMASTFSSLDGEGNSSPASLYAATKTAVESIARYYSDLSIHFLTFPDTYGPGDWRPKIHNIVLKNESWPFEFRSSSIQEMRMLHVDDIIGHLLASVENSEKGVHIHDIYAEGILVTLGELSKLLTDKKCLFNENSDVIEIPYEARECSEPTGHTNKHHEITFE